MISFYTANIEGVWFGVAYNGEEVFATSFTSNEKRALQDLMNSIPFNAPFQHVEEASIFAEQVIKSLKDIYDGKNSSHKFSLATEHLSKYFRKVIETVSLIPVGYVASYGSVARAVGGSPRAVGRVMASNPFAPIVPCHRVISSDFTLGGYGGGLDAKLAFLKREKRGYTDKQEIPINGKKLQMFPVEFVLRKVGSITKQVAKR
jgi:methylated-DNA-[protein]-cysteine S-methyltransferase